MPARVQPAKNTARFGASATRASAGTANSDPPVITGRGPYRSSSRPTGIPAAAETIRPVEKAAVTAVADQPVSTVMLVRATGKA